MPDIFVYISQTQFYLLSTEVRADDHPVLYRIDLKCFENGGDLHRSPLYEFLNMGVLKETARALSNAGTTFNSQEFLRDIGSAKIDEYSFQMSSFFNKINWYLKQNYIQLLLLLTYFIEVLSTYIMDF